MENKVKNIKKTYSEEEVQALLEEKEKELKSKALAWVEEKAQEKAEIRAIAIAEGYRELSAEEKRFEQDKKQLEFYIQEWALPQDLTLWKMMMNRQLWRELGLSLIQTINWIAFVNWRPAVYWETYLSLITKNWYKINVIEETEEKVEIELEGPNWKQKWSFTKDEAIKAWLWKNVYLKYPIRMLRYKAIRNAQNILCPEIMWWAYLVEEEKEIINEVQTWSEEEKQKASEILEKITAEKLEK